MKETREKSSPSDVSCALEKGDLPSAEGGGKAGVEAFRRLGLSAEAAAATAAAGYEYPTAIQSRIIPLILVGRDVIGASETGSGKTAAFVLPLLDCLGRESPGIQVLVLTPTRELCRQVAAEFRRLGRAFPLRVVEIFGGESYHRQRQALRQNPQVVVGAPGRVFDLLEQGELDFSQLRCLVLDEADRMLDMGFAPQIRRILRHLPPKRQTLMFSATIPRQVSALAKVCLTNPEHVQVGERARPPSQLVQEVIDLLPAEKPARLREILVEEKGSVLIFTQTKRTADEVKRQLEQAGFRACVLHSDCSQAERKKAIDGFRAGKYQMMVATDLASRGLDIEGITLVINYDLPENPEDYVHRIGRTGRADAPGRAVSFVTYSDYINLKNIERLTRHTFKNMAPAKRPLDHRAPLRRKLR